MYLLYAHQSDMLLHFYRSVFCFRFPTFFFNNPYTTIDLKYVELSMNVHSHICVVH
jgi:hypothetical protein